MRRQSFQVEVRPRDVLGAAEEVLPSAPRAEVIIATKNGEEMDFSTMMCATEYLMHVTAQQSNVGYERALELLVEGAKTWRSERAGP